ncbi:MAG TPA: F0F1 ATP synthase subunit A [Stellaceae bacterium]|nr:F0F1 ATP synthase subunit A [Stellaceae bacterium]
MAAASPLEQFTIERLIPIHVGRFDISYTNSALLMTIAVVLATLLLVGATARRSLVPGRLQSIAELLYEFVAGMVRENVGTEGQAYFPLVFSIFIFILFGNLLGLIPYSFVFTGQIVVTFALALFVFLFVTLIGFILHGVRFLTFFFPPGAPILMAPLLIPIEIISYLTRPVSLSLRLFANMLAGHTMLAVFAGFTVALGFLGFLPISFNVFLLAIEVVINLLQAYVFAILTCLYLSDAIHLH